jgi:hypothetical protein
MKKITLEIDEETLRKARAYAAKRDTTVTALVRDFLTDLTRKKTLREQLYRMG